MVECRVVSRGDYARREKPRPTLGSAALLGAYILTGLLVYLVGVGLLNLGL